MRSELKSFALFSAVLIIFSLFGASDVSASYFTIENFHSEITINKDASIVVEETIEVYFNHQRHGIFREIPYRYRNAAGDIQVTPIDVISVTDGNGRKRPSRVRHEGNVINIRIGSPNRYVDGHQTYVIKYRVERVLLFFEQYDELYWNVTGNYWDAPIRQASCNVTLDTDRDISNPRTACYSGKYGATNTNCKATLNEHGAVFICEVPLGEGEGFTVAYGFDKNIVEYPSAFENFLYAINIRENWVFVFPFISFFLMLYLYFTRGRDPKVQESVVVQYAPPKVGGREMTAAEVGTMTDESMDPRDISGTMIGLAVKGYIKIVEHKKEGLISLLDSVDYEIVRLKETDRTLTEFEQILLDRLFVEGGDTVMLSALKKKFYKYLVELKKSLMESLVADGYFKLKPDSVMGRYVGLAFIILVAGILFGALVTSDYIGKTIAATVLTAIWPAVFAKAMPVKTRLGAKAKMDILGFREFMMRADKDRLEKLGKDVFYKYMPYAIALDVVDYWSKAFEGIYDEPPNWYVSRAGFAAFSPVMFSKTITETTSTLSNTMFSAPRGSGTGGGGGGGFSGGGSGGGGGGSW